MECLHTASFLAIIICTFSTCAFGQTATVTGPVGGAIEAGQDAVFTCEVTGGNTATYVWNDQSADPIQQIFVNGGLLSTAAKYGNFQSSSPGDVMTIIESTIEDEGLYNCAIAGEDSTYFDFKVEVGSTLNPIFPTNPLLAGTEYTAVCSVENSRPQLNITWTLNGNTLGVTPDVTNGPGGNDSLSNTESRVAFTATPAMNGQDLKCNTSGHVVTSLNSEATTQLNVTYPPTNETATIAVVTTKEENNKLRVTCQVSAFDNGVDPANPAINMYNIYAGSEQINKSTPEENSVLVDNPENVTNYKCSASNDLGTIESEVLSYDPGQTTTQPTTTEPTTSEPSTTEAPAEGDTSKSSSTMPMETNKTDTIPERGLSTAAIVGTVIGVLLFIALVVVLVVIFVLKPDCISGKGSGPPPKTMALQEQKPTNGNSEKVAHPTAAPRQSTVPHRNDNPGGAVYAEVQKGGRGYDQPDHTHPPQGDSGMNYATLDLSEEAGHTERQVPQNKDNVVVYSSILV